MATRVSIGSNTGKRNECTVTGKNHTIRRGIAMSSLVLQHQGVTYQYLSFIIAMVFVKMTAL